MGRHAYLIMAHHRFEILREILRDIDDERNDIFLHIDKKTKNVDFASLKECAQVANLYFTSRIDVHWGGYSQSACMLQLLSEAVNRGKHDYYHFMVGVEFPLKTQDYIHAFMDRHLGKEFIGYDNFAQNYTDRVKYLHFFNEHGRSKNYLGRSLDILRRKMVALQKLLGYTYITATTDNFKKGNACMSITHDLAKHILSCKEQIKRLYKHSYCSDELFIHTLVYNSPFYDNVFDKNDEYISSMRMCQWEEGKNNQYHVKDVDMLIKSGRLFARKIDGDDALEVIRLIKERRRE